jgi:hypothetical protein
VGTSELAINSVGSASIIDGTITGADIATGTIGSADIADGSITAADLAANSVGSSELAAGSVGLATLASNSVNSAHIVNGSIGSADLNSNAVLITRQVVSGAAISIGGGGVQVLAQATCPSGYLAVAGGWALTAPFNSAVVVQQSFALGLDSWRFFVYNATSASVTFTPQVTCLRIN